MEILFKDHSRIYFLEDGILKNKVFIYDSCNYSNIPQLQDIKIKYHYRINDEVYPVLFDYDDRFVSINIAGIPVMYSNDNHAIKDYTLVNLNMIDNGGNII